MLSSSLRDIIHRMGSFGHAIPACGPPIDRRAIRIGHAEALGLLADSSGGKGRTLRWYFAHASVGSNIIDGVRELSGGKNFVFRKVAGQMPAASGAEARQGVIYEHNRGNPGWKGKMDQFAAAVQSGWRSPSVDVVLNKLCYIDQFASANYYLWSMARLETAFPNTILVYATMPLTMAADWKNVFRGGFNDWVRDWTQTNGRVLFDIADIEAHEPDGQACTFRRGKRLEQRLCPEYSDDGGHLNELGRRVLAQGFGALAAAVAKLCLAEQGRAGQSEGKIEAAA